MLNIWWTLLGLVGCCILIVMYTRARDMRQKKMRVAAAVQMIRESKGHNTMKEKSVCVLLNPYGGRGRARGIFQLIEPILRAGSGSLQVVETTHRGHGFELGNDLDFSRIDIVLVFSGDGLLHEVINGLCQRKNYFSSAIDGSQWPMMGIFPCGSGNGVAYSNDMDCQDPITLAIQLTKCESKCVEMMRVDIEGEDHPEYSMLSYNSALTARSELWSEQYLRCISHPDARDTVGAAIVLALGSPSTLRIRITPSLQHHPDELTRNDFLSPLSLLKHVPGQSHQETEYEFEGGVWYLICSKQTHLSPTLAFGPLLRRDDGCMQLCFIPKLCNVTKPFLLRMFFTENGDAALIQQYPEMYSFVCKRIKISVLPPTEGCTDLHMRSTSGEVWPEKLWNKDVELSVEKSRFRFLLPSLPTVAREL